jgi:hypothetical protein
MEVAAFGVDAVFLEIVQQVGHGHQPSQPDRVSPP